LAISPISYGPIQARIPDALLPISYYKKIGKAGAVGVALGCVVANIIFPYGVPDLVLGPLANILAGYSSYLCRNVPGYKGKLLAALISSFTIGALIGGILLCNLRCAASHNRRHRDRRRADQLRGFGLPLLTALERAY
jgi:hypothetical protein